jgi:hypothetical protein
MEAIKKQGIVAAGKIQIVRPESLNGSFIVVLDRGCERNIRLPLA